MSGNAVKVGVQIHPQQSTLQQMRDSWRALDAFEVDGRRLDSLWLWDHFYPLYGPKDGPHYEGWTSLTAMACDTEHASVGLMVASVGYRNPDLLADMARTVDLISGGRTVLGLGGGWYQLDYDSYGYAFGTARSRLADLGEALPRIRARLAERNPGPIGLPLLIGGRGEKVTLRLVAEHADAWNTFGPPEEWARLNRVLDAHCEAVGRDPAEIERTVLLNSADELDSWDAFVEGGCTHVIVGGQAPVDLDVARRLLELAGG